METYVLAPGRVVDKARVLKGQGDYREALDLLRRHCIIAEVDPLRGEMRAKIPAASKPKRRKRKEGSR